MGIWEFSKLIGTREWELPFSDVSCLSALHFLGRNSMGFTSFTYLSLLDRAFLKVRITLTAEDGDQEEADSFFTSVAAMLYPPRENWDM